MAYDLTTTSAISAEFKQFYDRFLLEAARPKLVFNQFGQARPIPGKYASSIEWRKWSLLSAATTALTEGTPPSSSNMTVTTVTASVAQYGAYVQGSERAKAQAFDDYLKETSQILGQQMGVTLDTLTRNVIVAGTTVQYGNGVLSRGAVGSGNYLDATEIKKAVRTLARADAPKWPGEVFYAIIHPDTKYDLLSDTTIVSYWTNGAKQSGSNPLFNGEVGDILGCRFFETSQAKIWTSLGATGADVYATMVFGQNAYGVVELSELSAETIYHDEKEGGVGGPLNQSWTQGWKASHAAQILDQNFMVRIEHSSSRWVDAQ